MFCGAPRAGQAEDAVVEHREVERVRVGGVVLDVGDSALEEVAPVRRVRVHGILRQVEAQLEAGSAVRGLVQPDRRSARRREAPTGDAGARVAGNRRAHEDVPRVLRVDGDLADAPILRDGVAARNELPVLAAVGGLVEAETGLAVARAAGLTGADVDRVAGLVGRVDQERADRGRVQPLVERLPVRVAAERVVGAPDPAARCADVEPALVRVALGVGDHRRQTAGPLGRQAVVLGGLAGDVEREGPDLLPGATAMTPVVIGVVVVLAHRGEGALKLGHRHRLVREREVGVRLLGEAVDDLAGCFTAARTFLARNRHGEFRSSRVPSTGTRAPHVPTIRLQARLLPSWCYRPAPASPRLRRRQ